MNNDDKRARVESHKSTPTEVTPLVGAASSPHAGQGGGFADAPAWALNTAIIGNAPITFWQAVCARAIRTFGYADTFGLFHCCRTMREKTLHNSQWWEHSVLAVGILDQYMLMPSIFVPSSSSTHDISIFARVYLTRLTGLHMLAIGPSASCPPRDTFFAMQNLGGVYMSAENVVSVCVDDAKHPQCMITSSEWRNSFAKPAAAAAAADAQSTAPSAESELSKQIDPPLLTCATVFLHACYALFYGSYIPDAVLSAWLPLFGITNVHQEAKLLYTMQKILAPSFCDKLTYDVLLYPLLCLEARAGQSRLAVPIISATLIALSNTCFDVARRVLCDPRDAATANRTMQRYAASRFAPCLERVTGHQPVQWLCARGHVVEAARYVAADHAAAIAGTVATTALQFSQDVAHIDAQTCVSAKELLQAYRILFDRDNAFFKRTKLLGLQCAAFAFLARYLTAAVDPLDARHLIASDVLRLLFARKSPTDEPTDADTWFDVCQAEICANEQLDLMAAQVGRIKWLIESLCKQFTPPPPPPSPPPTHHKRQRHDDDDDDSDHSQ
jgi:hypothetical protein